MHPLCGRRGMLFEYRAACSNPALALRMRAMGVAPRCAVMRIGRQMRWFEGVWWRKRRLVGEHGRRSAAVVSAGVVAQSAGWWARVAERYAAIIPAGVVALRAG